MNSYRWTALFLIQFLILGLGLLYGDTVGAFGGDYLKLKNKPFLTAKENPNRESFSSGSITAGKKYQIYKQQTGWYQIKTDDGRMGWVPEEFVDIFSEPVKNDGLKIIIRSPFINVMENPSETSVGKGMVERDNEILVLSEQNGWYKINYNGTDGWIPVKGTERVGSPVVTEKQLYSRKKNFLRVNSSFINIRENPLEASSCLGMVERGDEILILSEQNGWYQVSHKGIKGWIPIKEIAAEGVKSRKNENIKEKKRRPVQFVSRSNNKGSINKYAKWVLWGASAATTALAANYSQKGNSAYGEYKKAATVNDAVRLYNETISYDKRRDTMIMVAGINAGLGLLFHLLDRRNRLKSNLISFNLQNTCNQHIRLCFNVNF